MKSENIKIGKHLNDELWKNGIKNPPHQVKVIVKKDSENVVHAELFGAPEDKKDKSKKKKPVRTGKKDDGKLESLKKQIREKVGSENQEEDSSALEELAGPSDEEKKQEDSLKKKSDEVVQAKD